MRQQSLTALVLAAGLFAGSATLAEAQTNTTTAAPTTTTTPAVAVRDDDDGFDLGWLGLIGLLGLAGLSGRRRNVDTIRTGHTTGTNRT